MTQTAEKKKKIGGTQGQEVDITNLVTKMRENTQTASSSHKPKTLGGKYTNRWSDTD
jgi:hypothetical protein